MRQDLKMLLSTVKKSGKLILNTDAKGSMWATDAYWMIRVDEKHPVAELLAAFNLPFEPVHCEAWDTLRRVDRGPLPDVGKLLLPPKVKRTVVAPYELGGMPILTESQGRLARVWRREVDGKFVTLAGNFLTLIATFNRGERWEQKADSPLGPVYHYDDAGQLTALLMPVRTLLLDPAEPAAA